METWKDIRGYEGLYEVSDLGRIRSRGRLCKQKSNSVQAKPPKVLIQEVTVHGYCRVRLFDKNGEAKHFAVHRIVADSFIRRLEDGEQINHLNEIKTDNRLCNLEICTAKDNCNYGTRNNRLSEANRGRVASEDMRIKNSIAHQKPVSQFAKDGVFVAEYRSAKEAQEKTGIDAGHICSCRNGNRGSAGGYIWRSTACRVVV